MFEQTRKGLVTLLGVVLGLFTVVAVNFNFMQPQSALAIFMMLGMVLCYLVYPAAKWVKPPAEFNKEKDEDRRARAARLWTVDRIVGYLLAAATVACFGYIFVHTEPLAFFKKFWSEGVSLGNRAGRETTTDFVVGIVGLVLVLEATRRSIGWIVPALAAAFILHAFVAPHLPDWLLPHQGLKPKQIASSTFLQSLGVLGPAAGVMFKYVFLFVVFGAFLEMSGATQFIIDFSQRIFGRSPGGPAKVAVVGSGLMGSLSGSAVANAVTTGSFTIPMMTNSGFKPHVAGGITAAAASGGALVPPVMGAGAYMMLEFVKRPAGEPEVTFLEIAKAAIIPAILYYFSLWMIVHFQSRRMGFAFVDTGAKPRRISAFEGGLFFGALGVLVGLLIAGFSVFKSVTGALVFILVMSALRRDSALGKIPRRLALVAFFSVTALHQVPTLLADFSYHKPPAESVPGWLSPFVAPTWINPNSLAVEPGFVFSSLLVSSFIGMFGLLIFGLIHPLWRPQVVMAFAKSARNGISLVAASACVGIIIGIVQSTPIANDFGEHVKDVVEQSRLLALIGIMLVSIVLGMGVPSVVCYLLMATLMGALLTQLGVDPLAAHMFIFYFGMMSMVTPPVALAAYASASIAEAKIMPTALAAFRFSLVGFALPFMFVYRPALLLMAPPGEQLQIFNVIVAIVASTIGVVALAGGVVGFFKTRLSILERSLLVVAAAALLAPNVGGRTVGLFINIGGGVLFAAVAAFNWHRARTQPTEVQAEVGG